MSDQLRADTLSMRPPCDTSSSSILVNGQGPAIQEVLAFRNSLPSPASSDSEPIEAFHFPSGEHGGCFLQGTFPAFATSKARTALPTFAEVVVLMEYLASTFFDTTISGRLVARASWGTGTILATYTLSPMNSCRSSGW